MLASSSNSDFGCRFRGIPHDLMHIHHTESMRWERCRICGKTMRWRVGAKGRLNNLEYLTAHLRNACQKFGATKRVYNKLYRNENCKITL